MWKINLVNFQNWTFRRWNAELWLRLAPKRLFEWCLMTWSTKGVQSWASVSCYEICLFVKLGLSIFFASFDNCSMQIQYVSKPFSIGSDQTSWSQVWFMRLRLAISDRLHWPSLRFELFQEQLHHEEVSANAAFPWSACLQRLRILGQLFDDNYRGRLTTTMLAG